MATLKDIIKQRLVEADEPELELEDAPDKDAPSEDAPADDVPAEDAPVEDAPADDVVADDDLGDTDLAPEIASTDTGDTLERLVGIVDIEQTTSSTIISFEDGGQSIFVHPYVTLKSDTINAIIELIAGDVKHSYASQRDQISLKSLKETPYWKGIKSMIDAMVRSNLTNSPSLSSLLDEIKQGYKVLEVN